MNIEERIEHLSGSIDELEKESNSFTYSDILKKYLMGEKLTAREKNIIEELRNMDGSLYGFIINIFSEPQR